MSLPVPEVERELMHTRRLRFEGYRRADGLWDIDASLDDVKSHDLQLQSGVRRAGQAVHDMRLRITIDRALNVVEAVAVSAAVPYPGGCEDIAPAYRGLVGLNLMQGFRKRAAALFEGVKGCTHITELLMQLPTAAIQTFAGHAPEQRADGRMPFQLGHCHALELGSETVRKYYPQWYRGAPK